MAQTRRVGDKKRDSLSMFREPFARLFAECHDGRSDSESLSAFLDTLRVCERGGARLDAVHAALREAFEHALADKFYTELRSRDKERGREFRRFLGRLGKVRKRVETALREAIRLHEDVDRRQFAPELAGPYRNALAYLLDEDVVMRAAARRKNKGGNPHRHWVRSVTYPALKAAGVKKVHYTDLLRQLALIQ